jgi:Domain of unknown function (DUF222)/HNH endonuclease
MTMTITPPETDEHRSLDERLADACGQLNACHAALVDLVAEVIATDAWHGWGIRSIEQWITWRTGLSAGHARSLIAIATAAETHPKVCAAFAAGELSVDQAALAVRARPEHDDDIADWARVMTLSQLRTAVRASNTSAEDRENRPDAGGGDDSSGAEPIKPADAPTPERRDREYVSLQQDEDGSWRLHGRLDADHGAIVDAALSEARDRLFRDGLGDVTWADALVDIAERSLDHAPVERRERFRINLFLDPAASPMATWINGIGVPEAIRRLCACDGTISPVFVAGSRPVSVGRSQRIVPERTRRVVMQRDKKCRNPLCGATRGLEVHHVVHWHDLGGTDTDNLVALCRRCHRDHHLGRLGISGNADLPDGITFRDEHGRVIDTATHAAKPPAPPPRPPRPYRHPLGERLQRWAIQFNPSRPSTN